MKEPEARTRVPSTYEHLRVITFNTAVGNPRIETAQRAFLELPFYRDVIEGRSEAPILALQEVGPSRPGR